MNILFTGATGFIGSHFIRQFPQHDYTVLTRSPQRAARLLPGNIKFIASLSELESLDGFDAVINLCGEPIVDKRWSPKQKDIICQSRWQPTSELVDLFGRSEQPPATFISGSAIGFYGDTGDRKTSEDNAPLSQDFAYTVCDQWEQRARRAADKTRLVILRTGVVLGRDGGALKKMLPPFKWGVGGRVGSGQQYMSWIHIEDMVEAIHYLLNSPEASGVFNLTAPDAVQNDTFTNALANAMHTKPRLPVPETLLRLMLGESADLLLNSQRIYPKRLLAAGYKFHFPDVNGALADVLAS
ncbi:MAG: TIGR01777 family protein [Gammaproteobacteria bacterium]|uniref:TIGR01777 family oxidoreductase n=1 Tax=Pseudomaricurvus alcaniphilus TaxID=1166482 RepID=UPI00140A562B|nr:TIGR01777 family oxidoreductase [Pseudomaricurvus alcaniphilus]MBR9909631.1 TIGR01777 family protein [Gammaproteobacteria bacterium]NHN36953.1 TIGR01777 family protein [Pseudomaricurvus alcaniphilus]